LAYVNHTHTKGGRAMHQRKVITTNDIVFRKIFASPQNSHILIGFINDMLGLDVTEVSVENTYNIKNLYDGDKAPILRYTQVDVLARLRDGRLVTIEMQVYRQLWFRERALYYVAETYTSNYAKKAQEIILREKSKQERRYSSLRPVYSICILTNNEFEDEQPIHKFKLYDTENDVRYTNVAGEDLLTMVFMELQKSSDQMNQNAKEWFAYFKTGEVSANAPKYMLEACEQANYKNLQKEEKDMVSARERAEQDALAREDYAWIQGLEKGKRAGEERARNELIYNMRQQGLSTKEIAKFTGVSQKEIESVREI